MEICQLPVFLFFPYFVNLCVQLFYVCHIIRCGQGQGAFYYVQEPFAAIFCHDNNIHIKPLNQVRVCEAFAVD